MPLSVYVQCSPHQYADSRHAQSKIELVFGRH